VADFLPVAPEFHQRTHSVRLRNLGITDKKSSHKIKYKKIPRVHKTEKGENMQEIYELLCGCAGAENVRKQEAMNLHTTFRIGGPADLFVTPESIQAAADTIRVCKEQKMPYAIIGNGSNLLVADEGYRGVIIQIARNLNQISVNKEELRAQAGAMLSVIAKTALAEGLTGLEFASGIPGTLGGAVIMNAGAYGGEMKDVLKAVTVLTAEGEIRTVPADKLELGYRTSLAAKNGWIILEAVMKLNKGDTDAIRSRMEELKVQRVTKQPLELPSAGSTFKRPEGYFAGKLIMDAGLRGFSVGGAQVSEKHCGFVVNRGGATADDVRALIRAVQKKVFENSGVMLEPEVKFLGDFAKADEHGWQQ